MSDTLWPMDCSTPRFPVHHQLPEPTQVIKSVMPFNRLILCRPLLLLPSIFPSIRVFSDKSVFCIRWPKLWSFSFSTSPSNDYSGLISFRMDWFDLLAFQGTLKNLLQHHSLKAHHVKCWAGWHTSWNQVFWEKCQQPHICRWYHFSEIKQRGTKEPLDESERGQWKSWLKAQHSEN